MRNGKQLHITSEEATGDRLNDRIRSIEYVRAGERINAASARPRGTPLSARTITASPIPPLYEQIQAQTTSTFTCLIWLSEPIQAQTN